MGLTKQYLRYGACGIFGIVGSKSNVTFLEFKGIEGKLCAVGACEHVFIWDLRKGEKVKCQTASVVSWVSSWRLRMTY